MRRLLLTSLSAALLGACATGEATEPGMAPPALAMPSAPLPVGRPVDRIAFGSCNQQADSQAFWAGIAATEPDLFVYLGDNVYGDVTTGDPALPELRAAYYRLAASEEFAAFRDAVPVLPVWDDHDYGLNDAGGDFSLRAQSEALFEDVWALPPDDPRRGREGVYGAYTVGAPGRRVQVVLLDTRYFRSPLTPTDEPGAPGRERYVPSVAGGQTMLGAEQEAWLEGVLAEPAELRVLVTSVQLLADGHGWEGWAALPDARARLYETLTGAEGTVLVVSGDRHAGALYEKDLAGRRLTEMTASSLNAPATGFGPPAYEEAGPNRLGPMVREANFGLLEVDWDGREATFSLRGTDDRTYQRVTVPFGDPRLSAASF